eukprot:a2594_126.p2 GENE.a2594_126~~a2594_126.p2  ORF type:complete len:204 (-),score=42.23 a2594_126:62-634(-)
MCDYDAELFLSEVSPLFSPPGPKSPEQPAESSLYVPAPIKGEWDGVWLEDLVPIGECECLLAHAFSSNVCGKASSRNHHAAERALNQKLARGQLDKLACVLFSTAKVGSLARFVAVGVRLHAAGVVPSTPLCVAAYTCAALVRTPKLLRKRTVEASRERRRFLKDVLGPEVYEDAKKTLMKQAKITILEA